MPEMDGFETTQNMVEICGKRGCEMPYVVALTAHSKED
jgi:CheY-like chemotaxis protein